MGLDMYLDRFPKGKTKEQIEQESNDCWDKGMEVWQKEWRDKYRVAYWRKVNFLHGWFVNTLADGVDECQEIEVHKEDIFDLMDLVKEACDIISQSVFVPHRRVESDSFEPRFEIDQLRDRVPAKWDGDMFTGLEDGVAWLIDDEHTERLATILPPAHGFFFGSYQYDCWYAHDMMELRNTVDKILSEWDDGYKYIYQASW